MNASPAENSSQSVQLSSYASRQQDAGESLTADGQVCWIEVKHSSYQANHQVELLHLQAEADALLMKLQAINQERRAFVDECQR